MGQLAFSRNYGMLDSGELHWAVELLAASMEASPSKPPVWLFRILVEIPGLLDDFHKFIRFCKSELKSRAEHKNPGRDITGWLLKPYQGVSHPEEDPIFQGDTRLVIVAGSDTTSACLTFLFYELAKHPEEVTKLRDELKLLTKNAEWSDNDVKNAPHLNGAINESLRMHPPVPSGVQRLTPREGMQVGDVFVPGNVNFWVPMYPMGRGELVSGLPRLRKNSKVADDPLSRRINLRTSARLLPRALVREARDGEAQGGFCSLLHGTLRLHRQRL